MAALFLGAFAKFRKALLPSPCLSVRMELSSQWTDFEETWYLSFFFLKICQENLSFIKIRQE